MTKKNQKQNLFQRFNDYLADRLSYLLSIMATFYFVSLLVVIPLFYSQPTSFVAWASYICSVIFQGIALPVLGYTSRKASDKTDEVMGHMFKMTKEIDRLVKIIEKQQEHMSTEMDELVEIEKEHTKKNENI
jgi:hypothetical protein